MILIVRDRESLFLLYFVGESGIEQVSGELIDLSLLLLRLFSSESSLFKSRLSLYVRSKRLFFFVSFLVKRGQKMGVGKLENGDGRGQHRKQTIRNTKKK